MLAKHDAGRLSIKRESRLDVAEMGALYLEARAKEVAKGELTAKYLKKFAGLLRRHLAPHFGSTPVSQIDHRTLQRFVNVLADRGMKPNTVQNAYQHVRALLKWAFTQGYISELPHSPKLPTMNRTTKKVYTWQELSSILNASAPKYRPVFLALACTGMRPSELLRVKWKDIDLDKRVLYVKRSKSVSGERAILLPNLLIEELLKLERVGEYVFHDGFGDPLTLAKIYNPFKKALAKVGLTGYPYLLRHTHTTLNLQVPGLSDKIISERQGHSDERFTRAHYMHPQLESQEPIADFWDDKLTEAGRTN